MQNSELVNTILWLPIFVTLVKEKLTVPWKAGISATEKPVCGPKVRKQAQVAGKVIKSLQDDKQSWKQQWQIAKLWIT